MVISQLSVLKQDHNYISELFNSSKPAILEENKSYLYNIDGITYYVYINENNSYKIRIIKNDKEGILEYQYLEQSGEI